MIYAYIFVMAGVTYLIRMLPLTLIQKKITNVYFRSFLYYIPYACLTAGNSLCHAVPCLRYGGTCDRSTPCTQEEKPDRCGRVCLRGSFSGRTTAGNVVK